MIKRNGNKWELWSADGKKLLGTHNTRGEALAQERAIQANKKRGYDHLIIKQTSIGFMIGEKQKGK
jgi:hypothetical protein